MRPSSNVYPSNPVKLFLLAVPMLLTACASNYQGGVGPLANPKAAQIVDLADELLTRAERIQKNVANDAKTICEKNNRTLELAGGKLTDDVAEIESRLWKSSAIPKSATDETRCLNQAHAAFEKALHLIDKTAKEAERNDLQDRLMTASDQSCGLFKKYLNANQSSTNFLFGTGSLVLAAAATNVTSAVAAKNYATGALIGTGVSAQYNADMFNSQVAFAIAKAIDTSRSMARENLQKERNKGYSEYGLSAAIGDALRYHELCSLMAGLATMDHSTAVLVDPGIQQMQTWFASGELTTKDGTVIKITPPQTAKPAAKK